MGKLLKKMSFFSVLMAIVFMFVQVLSDLYLPTLTSDIINNGVSKGDIKYIWSVGLVMLGYSVISILASIGNTFFATKESQKLGKRLRSEIYQKVEYASLDQFDRFGTATLITRTTNDVNQIQMVTQMGLRIMLMAPITLIGASIMAYRLDHQLTKIFLYVIPILMVFLGVVMYFAVPLFKSMQTKTDKLNLIFREGLTGVRVIRAFNRDDYEAKRFDTANQDFVNTAIKVNTIVAFLIPIVTLIMSGTNILIVWQGGHYIANMEMDVGNLIAFMTYATQILMSFMMLSMIFVFVPRAQASAERINEVLDMKEDIQDPEKPVELTEASPELSFQQVDFRYAGAERCSLQQIDFTAKKGETVAIIGGTGSGKTTLVNLIPRFFEVENGSIQMNGTDIRSYQQKDLRSRIGFVPQKARLFKGSIRDNMLYGDQQATDEQIWKALEIAQAKDFVSQLPDGLDSGVEQGGGNFSGGQRQRLCIARALVKQADIYVFDDSFSALDFKTDGQLRQALKENVDDSIVVLVAQRISTVVDADIILVLDEGKMVGKGTHQELKENCTTYQEIISSQLREEEIA